MPAAIPLAIVAAGAIGSAVAANEQAGASTSAAKTQADAATQAANLQAKAAADALTFQKQQAQQTLDTANATQGANYQQWAARQGRISSLGQMLGLPPEQIPAYVPLPGAGSSPGAGTPMAAAPAPGGGAPSAAAGNWNNPAYWTPQNIQAVLQATGQPAAPDNVQYFIGKAPELIARGQQLNDPNYAFNRLSNPNSGNPSGASSGAAASFNPVGMAGAYGPIPQAQPGTLGALANPYQVPVPTTLVIPGSLGSYVNG